MDVLVVLPTYNESENIDHVLRRIRSAVPAATVLVVDDGSPDGTADIAEIVGKELGNIEVLRRGGKSGLGSAYRAGFRWGLDRGFDACIEMDADLSHEPEALPSLVAPLADLYASTLLGLGVADATAGFRAYAATLLRRLDLDAVRAEGYGFQIEMTYATKNAGGSILEVPIRFVDRVEGESKMSTFIVVEALGLVTLWGVERLFGSPKRDRQVVRT